MQPTGPPTLLGRAPDRAARPAVRPLRPRRVGPRRRLRRPHRPHLPPGRRHRHGADRLRPARGAQRLPAAHRRRAATARSTTRGRRRTWAACCSPATGRHRKDGGWAFCSGGDQRIRGRSGYQYAERGDRRRPSTPARAGRLHILECQRLIRFMPKVVICRGPGLGGRRRAHLHVVCDLTLASARARALQADRRRRRLASTAASARPTSPGRSARSSPARSSSSATSTPPRTRTGWAWSTRSCRTPTWSGWRWSGRARSTASRPTAQRMLKYAFNLIDDGLVGQQLFAGEATRLAYMTDEAVEGRDAFLEKRDPDWSPVPLALLNCHAPLVRTMIDEPSSRDPDTGPVSPNRRSGAPRGRVVGLRGRGRPLPHRAGPACRQRHLRRPRPRSSRRRARPGGRAGRRRAGPPRTAAVPRRARRRGVGRREITTRPVSPDGVASSAWLQASRATTGDDRRGDPAGGRGRAR